MPDMNVAVTEDFASMLEESIGIRSKFEGSVVTGRVMRITDEYAIVDVGLKSEGRVALREFNIPGDVAKGDSIVLYIERYEDKDGGVVLSREKARREESWINLNKSFEDLEKVSGTIISWVKGGFTVDLSGVSAFLPGSQVDIRPVPDMKPLMHTPLQFRIIKMDRAKNNVVVSRRAVLEESRAEQRGELIKGLAEGMVLDGLVKNITDYGAFVDLGGVDGLLHVTDMAWRRINHPTEAVTIGQQVRVKVIRFNSESQRISLGMKQLEEDPWIAAAAKYELNGKFFGRVTNIADFGAFVELEPGIEGLVHVSEMSWAKKNTHPGQIVATSQEVEVVILDFDGTKRRISLGMKQAQINPWERFCSLHPVGTEVEGEIRAITEFAVFVSLGADIDGMVHLSDLSWDDTAEVAVEKYAVGQTVRCKVLVTDVEQERVGLGIKQMIDDPAAPVFERVRKGTMVSCIVTAVQANGIQVTVEDILTGFIRRAELSNSKDEQRPDRFNVGDTVEAMVVTVDRIGRKVSLTVKGREKTSEKKSSAEYGSSNSGASLGDILSAAIRRATDA